MADSTSPSNETFFITGVGLISSREELPADASAPERLAFHLLRPPKAAPGAREFARASRDPRAHRATAAYLLDEAIAREVAGRRGAAIQDLWTVVDEAWLSLAASSGAAEELSALGESLGIAAPEEVARAVLARISTDLLPGLHALFAFKAADPDHETFHLTRMEAGEGYAMAAACTRARARRKLTEVRALKERSNLVVRVLEDYLEIKTRDSIELGRLSTEVADFLVERFRSIELRSFTMATATLGRVETAAGAFPFDHRIHLMAGELHLLCGILANEAGAPLLTVALHVATAAVIHPSSPQVGEALATFKRDLRDLIAKVAQAVRGGAVLNRRGESNLAAAQEALRVAEGFARSPQAQAIRLSLHKAFWGQLALRLGLDPSNDAATAAAAALAGALEPKDSPAMPLSDLRARLVEKHPILASAPWAAIEEVLSRKAPITAPELAAALPRPPLLDDKTEDQAFINLAFHRLRVAAERRRTARRSARVVSVYPWLFSRRDRLAKAVGAIGVICIAAGALLFGVRAWDANRRDAAYDKLHTAVIARRPAEVISAAQQFIAHTDRGFNDYRIPEVVDAYSQALLQEITRTATAGPDKELARLLDGAKALKAWAPSPDKDHMEASKL